MAEHIMTFIWLGLLIIFTVTEIITAQLTTIWFAVGALASLLISTFGVNNIIVQIIIFTMVSLVSLALSRPLVKKFITRNVQPTNADRNIGETAIVTESINNIEATGAVKINGIVWSARSQSGNIIPAGELVTVKSIDGVKLIVN